MRNFKSYYERMGKNVQEKTDFIIQELQTGDYNKVLDFGCANGVVTEYLAQMFPKIKFYGYDCAEVTNTNLERQSQNPMGKEENVFYIEDLNPIIYKTNYGLCIDNKTLVILSSVLHENFMQNHFTEKFEKAWYKYLRFAEAIAIRDMRGDFFLRQTNGIVQDLIARTLYRDNYKEEMEEDYFSIQWWLLGDYMQNENYEKIYEHWYMNQYLKKKIPEINSLLCKTHCKQIWKRRKTL